jgi:conjugative relaxase-like TrwC/TraI family protein
VGVEFDHHVSNPDYYLQEEGIEQARFGGRGARQLGLPERFEPVTYRRLFEGQNPHTGEQLTARARRANARAAYDITVTMPKAVSVLRHVLGDERIAAAFEDANAFAMKLVERQTVIRVQTGGRNSKKSAEGIAYLSVPHAMTRPVAGEADPHGHFHNLVFNVAYDRAAGIWKALEFGKLDRKAISDAYHNRLASNMRKLGYQARWDGKDFHVKGVTKDVQDLYCRRRDECEREKERRGNVSPAVASKLAVITRSKKRQTALGQLVSRWIARLTREQFSRLTEVVQRAKDGLRRARMRVSVAKHLDRMRATQQYAAMQQDRGRER